MDALSTQVQEPVRTVAVCFFGLLPRLRKTTSDSVTPEDAVKLFREWVVPSYRANIEQANKDSRIDVFVHNSEPRRATAILEELKPRAAAFGLDGMPYNVSAPGDGRWSRGCSPMMYASIERVLMLKRAAEMERGAAYDLVLLSRTDIIWFRSFNFDFLNSSLFYFAHWCKAKWTAEPGRTECRRMRESGSEGTPDFWFAGGSHVIDRVFVGFTSDYEAAKFSRTISASNHGMTAGRLKSLGLWNRVGRYLRHEFDVTLLRQDHFQLSRHANASRLVIDNQTMSSLRCDDHADPWQSPWQLKPGVDRLESGGSTLLPGQHYAASHLPQRETRLRTRLATSRPHCPADLLYCVCPRSRWVKDVIERAPNVYKQGHW